MRKVIVRDVPPEPEDAQLRERLLALLSTGLQRLLSGEPVSEELPSAVDYCADLPRTSDTTSGMDS